MDLEPTIGLEVHTHLLTKSKVFCGCANKFGAPPNTLVCPVCMGLPGSLPVLNKEAVNLALKAALALNCKISSLTKFDRKNYYYPDLPKNYQISQNYINLGSDGALEIEVDGRKKKVGIHNVHLEEDAGKLLHGEEPGANYSLVDLNRAGVPLLEIVTKPEMKSAAEVDAFMHTLRDMLIYLDVSACKMEEGALRFEASISLAAPGSQKLGNRVEVKNLNSMDAVVKTVEYEIKRQAEILRVAREVERETRLWDEVNLITTRMRTKELAHDYRYFPEPDLVPLVISDEWLEEIKASLIELPQARKERFISEYGLPEYDAKVLVASRETADYFEEVVAAGAEPKSASNWVMGDMAAWLNAKKIELSELKVTPQMLARLTRLVAEGIITHTMAKEVFLEMAEKGKEAEEVIKARGLVQISDETELGEIIDKVISENPQAQSDFKSGKSQVLQFLIGQVMRATKGQANVQVVQAILREKLK
jgi:aspartyl-tRNA(Asn)/glutamyl-tRNA(Gln) amidotransferase subunit B